MSACLRTDLEAGESCCCSPGASPASSWSPFLNRSGHCCPCRRSRVRRRLLRAAAEAGARLRSATVGCVVASADGLELLNRCGEVWSNHRMMITRKVHAFPPHARPQLTTKNRVHGHHPLLYTQHTHTPRRRRRLGVGVRHDPKQHARTLGKRGERRPDERCEGECVPEYGARDDEAEQQSGAAAAAAVRRVGHGRTAPLTTVEWCGWCCCGGRGAGHHPGTVGCCAASGRDWSVGHRGLPAVAPCGYVGSVCMNVGGAGSVRRDA